MHDSETQVSAQKQDANLGTGRVLLRIASPRKQRGGIPTVYPGQPRVSPESAYGTLTRCPEITTLKSINDGKKPAYAGATLSESA